MLANRNMNNANNRYNILVVVYEEATQPRIFTGFPELVANIAALSNPHWSLEVRGLVCTPRDLQAEGERLR